MLHIFQSTYIYSINKLVTCESTLEITRLIFLFKNVTILRQMLSVLSLIFKHFKISLNPFLGANSNHNEKKIGPLGLVCHGLQENAFQVNQLYNVTWSNMYVQDWQIRLCAYYFSQKATKIQTSLIFFINQLLFRPFIMAKTWNKLYFC